MPQTKIGNKQLPDVIQNKTLDTSNDIDTTTTKLTITGGTNGQVLSTDGSGNLSWITAGGSGAPYSVVSKTTSETILNSATLQDDDELFVTVPSGAYWVEFNLIVQRSNLSSNPGLKLAMDIRTTPGNVITNAYWRFPYTTGVGNIASGTTGVDFTTAINVSGNITCNFYAAQQLQGSSMIIRLRWCQSTANATTGTTIMTGSQLKVYKTA